MPVTPDEIERLLGGADEDAGMTVVPGENTGGSVQALFDDDERQQDAFVRRAFDAALPTNMAWEAPREVVVQRFAGQTGLDAGFVERNLDELSRTWEAAKFDPAQWRQDNPDLDRMVRRKPDLAKLAVRDPHLSALQQALSTELQSTNVVGDLWKKLNAGLSLMAEGTTRGAGALLQLAAQSAVMPFAEGPGNRDGLRLPNPLDPLADLFSREAEQAGGSVSGGGQEKVEGSTPTGNLLEPSTWSLGEAPTLEGYALHGAELFGQMLPIVAASWATRGSAAAGAILGGLQGGGAAVDQAREAVDAMATAPGREPGTLLIADESPAYRRLRTQGMTHEQAVAAVRDDAAQWAFVYDLPVSALGGAATSKILHPAEQFFVGQGRAVGGLSRVLLGALEEGTQEVGETVATNLGIRQGSEADGPLFEGTFGDFVLGALGGGAPASVSAFASARSTRIIEGIHQVAQGDTAQADPESVARMIEEATAAGGEPVTHVYLDPDATLRLFQEAGVDLAAALGETAAQQIAEARATGGKLEIPVATYLDRVGSLDFAPKLVEHATVRPGTLTAAEQRADAARIEEQAQELVRQFEQRDVPPSSPEEAAFLRGQEEALLLAGVAKSNVRTQLAPLRAFAHTMAARSGRPAAELFRGYTLQIEGRKKKAQPAAEPAPEAALVEVEPEAAAPILAAQDEIPGASRTLTDAFLGMSREEQVGRLFRDTNTGLLNRRGFEALPADPERPLVAHISVEGTKFVNDTRSHVEGDALYRTVGAALAEVAPDAAKVGGDFAVRVKDQAELDGLLAQIGGRPEFQGLQVTGAVGETFQAAGQAHGQVKAGLEEEGKRAKRGDRPLGLSEGAAFDAPEATAQPLPPGLDGAFDALAPEEAFSAIYIEEASGLLTGEGFYALPKKAQRLSLDVDGLAWINQVFGQEGGDKVLRALGELAAEIGGADFDLAHVSGDEFRGQADDAVALEEFAARMVEVAADLEIEFPAMDGGETFVLQGVTFSHGTGATDAEADAALNRHKAERAEAGLRGEAAYAQRLARRDPGDGEVGAEAAGGGDPAPGARPRAGRRQRFAGRRLGVVGADTRVVTPQRPQGERAHYAVIEAADLIPSHDPRSFTPHPDYPPGVQEREYHRQPEEKAKVAQGAATLNPALLLTDTPTAVDGPPLVTAGGKAIVLGGNGRSMMLLRAFGDEGARAKYRDALFGKAQQFGLDPAKLEAMQAPVLVRVLDEVPADGPQSDLVAAVRRTNEGMTQALSPKVRAVAEAKTMAPATVASIGELLAGSGDASLRDVMRDRPGELVAILRRDGIITPQNQAAWLQGAELNAEAKDRIEGMFLGRVMGSGDRLAKTSPALAAKVERIAPAILRVEGVNPEASATMLVQQALDLVNDAKTRGLSLEQMVGQRGLFGGDTHDPHVVRMAGLLDRSKPRELEARFNAWAHEAARDPRQSAMFEASATPEQHRAKLLSDVLVFKQDERAMVLYQPAKEADPRRAAVEMALAKAEDEIRVHPVEHAITFDLNDGSETFRKTTNHPSQVEFTTDEIEAMRAHGSLAFTHNHPQGRVLSLEDITFAVATNLAEMRAVVPSGGVWRVVRPMLGWGERPPLRPGQKLTDLTLNEIRRYNAWVQQFRAPYASAMRAGAAEAAAQMDEIVRAAGGRPEDGESAKGFDRGTWHRVWSEGVAKKINEYARQLGAGWQIERLDSAERQGDARRLDPAVPAAEGSREEARRAQVGQQLRLLQRSSDTARGLMERSGNDFRIVLAEKADLSTFLHETGHLMLELFGDLAERPDAPQQIRDDYSKILGWLEVQDRSQIKTQHHEQMARGFERYLMEGEAPSKELRAAFGRFKEWLKRIYRSVKALDVDLSDEVRGVFDRLLATDEEIARMQGQSGLKLMFRSPEDAGMTPEEWQAYLGDFERATSATERRANLKLLKDQLREKEAAWKEEAAKLRDEARGEYDRLPARRAWQFLRGKTVGEDGTEIGQNNVRLDFQQTKAILGERAKRFLTSTTNGVSPDEVAPMFGFASGREMLEAADALLPREQWAKERAREVMVERHGDLLQDRERLREEVGKGLHGDFTAQWLLREWRALRARAGDGKAPPIEAIKRAAQILASRRKIADLRPEVALVQERSAANRAMEAATKGNYAQAAVYKQQQLLNMYLWRALRDAKDEAQRAFEHLEARTGDSYRAGLGKASQAYLGAHDAILAAVGIGPERADVGEQLAALEAAAALAAADGAAVEFDLDAIRTLIARPKGWKALTVPEALNVRDAVKNIRAIANATTAIMLDGQRQQVEEIVARIAEESKALPDLGKAPASRQQVGKMRRALDVAIGLNGALIEPERMLESLGPTMRAVFDRYLEGKTEKYRLLKELVDPLVKRWQGMPEETMRRRWDVIPELDTALPLSPDVNLAGPRDRMWLIMGVLHMGSESNRERMLGGFGWTAEQFLEVARKHLTKAEWDWAQSIWEMNDKHLWPMVKAKEERKNGLAPDKIVATPIVTPHGTYSGGYFPAKYDPRASIGDVGERQAAEGIANLYGPGYVRAHTPKSHAKKRAERYQNVMELDWGTVPGHIAQVVHDLAFDEFVRDAGRIVFHPKVQEVLYRRLGEKRAKEPRDWLRYIANSQAVTAAQQTTLWAKATGALKTRTVLGAIGWASTVAMSDFSNAFVAIGATEANGGVASRYGVPAYLAALPGVGRMAGVRQMALEKSPELRARLSAFDNERRQHFLRAIGLRKGKLSRALETVSNTAWFFLEQTDKMASTQIWLGRYWEATAKGVTEKEAVRLADAAVRKNLMGPERAEASRLMRDPGAVGSVMVFAGYFNKILNVVEGEVGQTVRVITAAKRGEDSWGNASLRSAKLAGSTLAVFFFANVAGELLAGRGPDEDEPWEEWIGRKMLGAPIALIPIAGPDLEAAFQSAWTGRPQMATGRAPSLSFVWDQLANVKRLLDEDVEDDRKAWAAVELLLAGAKLPVRQPKRTLDYVQKAIEGEVDLDDPLSVTSGLFYGERDNQPLNPFTATREAVR